MISTHLRSFVVVSALAGAILASRDATAQSTGACTDSATSQARGYRDYYGVVVSLTDTAAIRWRTQIGLPTLLNSQVRLVSDTAICRIASQAYDATLEVPYPAKPVIVLELGSKRMVIKDIGFRGAMLNLLFDQTFATLLHRVWN